MPTLRVLRDSMSPVKKSVAGLPPADRILLVPLKKEYTVVSLATKGVNAMTSEHRAKFEALVTAELTHAVVDSYYHDDDADDVSSTTQTALVRTFDSKGHDVTKKEKEAWLKDVVVDFSAAAEGAAGGMVLARASENPNNIWGNNGRFFRETGYSSYDEGILMKKYRASFILGKSTCAASVF